MCEFFFFCHTTLLNSIWEVGGNLENVYMKSSDAEVHFWK